MLLKIRSSEAGVPSALVDLVPVDAINPQDEEGEAEVPDEISVRRMTDMGLKRDWCVLVLRRERGDVESAVALCTDRPETMLHLAAAVFRERE